jgi:hypothetical protein
MTLLKKSGMDKAYIIGTPMPTDELTSTPSLIVNMPTER